MWLLTTYLPEIIGRNGFSVILFSPARLRSVKRGQLQRIAATPSLVRSGDEKQNNFDLWQPNDTMQYGHGTTKVHNNKYWGNEAMFTFPTVKVHNKQNIISAKVNKFIDFISNPKKLIRINVVLFWTNYIVYQDQI